VLDRGGLLRPVDWFHHGAGRLVATVSTPVVVPALCALWFQVGNGELASAFKPDDEPEYTGVPLALVRGAAE
jgi:hypothetical protein